MSAEDFITERQIQDLARIEQLTEDNDRLIKYTEYLEKEIGRLKMIMKFRNVGDEPEAENEDGYINDHNELVDQLYKANDPEEWGKLCESRLNRIVELEEENQKLKSEIESLKNALAEYQAALQDNERC